MDRQIKKLESQDISKKLSSDISLNNISVNSLSNSQTNFANFGSSKSEFFTTMIQVMKSDIAQLQENINASGHLLTLMKGTANKALKAKIVEIEEGKKIGAKVLLDKISEDSNDLDKLSKLYKTGKKTELISKLANEVFHYELLFKKLNEYFLILLYSFNKEDGFKDSHSKIAVLIECINQIKNSKTEKKEAPKEKEKVMITQKEDSSNNKSLDAIWSCKSINDFFNSNDRYLSKIEDLISENMKTEINKTIELLNSNLSLGVKKLENINDNYKLEIFNKKKLEIERFLEDKKKQLKDNELKLENSESIVSQLNNKINQIEVDKKRVNDELDLLKKKLDESNKSKNEVIVKPKEGEKKNNKEETSTDAKVLLDLLNESK